MSRLVPGQRVTVNTGGDDHEAIVVLTEKSWRSLYPQAFQSSGPAVMVKFVGGSDKPQWIPSQYVFARPPEAAAPS